MSGKPKSVRLVALLATLLVVTAPLAAQKPAEHRGPFIGLGLGWGSARLSCNICTTERNEDISGFLRMGLALSQQFLVGLEADGWYDKATVSQFLGSAGLALWMYPSRKSGFYLKTGVGVSKYTASDEPDHFKTSSISGQIGVGYEFGVYRGVSVGPYANFIGTTSSSFSFNDTVVDGSANSSLIQIGVAVTLH
jgi:hypothetical protein